MSRCYKSGMDESSLSRSLHLLMLSAALAACGGGGGSSPAPAPTPSGPDLPTRTQAAGATAQSASTSAQTAAAPAVARQGPTIKDAYAEHFLIGMAGDIPGNYSEVEKAIVTGHFNAVTPENCMKPSPVQPSEDTWRFERPDALVKFCEENKLAIHGHTFVWHAQTAGWFLEEFVNEGTQFVHLDIAGVFLAEKEDKYWRHPGATGAGVRLAVELATLSAGGRADEG